MNRLDVKKIIEYEEFKKDFFEKKNTTELLDDEFSCIEEKKYGENLCKIYVSLFKINNGKLYLKNTFINIILSVLILLYNLILLKYMDINNQTYRIALIVININIVIYLLIKLMIINKYREFVVYFLEKLIVKK